MIHIMYGRNTISPIGYRYFFTYTLVQKVKSDIMVTVRKWHE